MRTSILLGLSFCLAFPGAPAIAQTSSSDGGIRTHIQGIDIPPVANAPFTAKVVVTWDQPLVGGGTISRKYYTMVARDSHGRVRRETRDFVAAGSSAEPPLRTFTILDPVGATRTTCTQATMTCTTTEFHSRISLAAESEDASSGNERSVHRINLGEQTLDSLPVKGTRETRSTVAGSNGSDRVVVSHRDLWYSPDLQMDLSVIRINPQMGQLTLNVTDLVRGEPDSSWLSVPSGYETRNAYVH
jgi:hypothetical protein